MGQAHHLAIGAAGLARCAEQQDDREQNGHPNLLAGGIRDWHWLDGRPGFSMPDGRLARGPGVRQDMLGAPWPEADQSDMEPPWGLGKRARVVVLTPGMQAVV
ncbi:MAG: hypothetical protein BroJett029_06060 [Alphaproteobacteria bacterium]|nr:MAG: hypothetical protein BroJett029_06060 [Alphaproteobacteria bacterium]